MSVWHKRLEMRQKGLAWPFCQQGTNVEAPRRVTKQRIEAGKQPRGNRYPHIIPEFRITVEAVVDDDTVTRWGIRKGENVKESGHMWCDAAVGPKRLSVESGKGGW